ncbi:hypothetical protein J4Q44_G00357770 [Coregonus suidteri]|uniref:Uncharacterized protein n=1 Tax=Coregonus suidteri TaxID=861788 RepID=A0AAN8QBD2_9TELE
MFQAAGAGPGCGGGESELRRSRRLTEHRRHSTLLPGVFAEEQERLRELAMNAREEQRGQEKENPAGFDTELLFNVYTQRGDQNFALFNYVLEQSRIIEEMTKDLKQVLY